ncbi:transport protein Avl9-domain-containing protein [Jimgerdemannia flammicorona]|uniref:Transport protein Avl9-domain-containing protein n=1 Tax=Jimgerdemannia flammicorona TaxID=994334 RepID=A0A433QTZ0_9FUNG|nr:transport protein Avl9-domain-containing protein [Jimgerdemannia flammicorona]
MEFLTILGASWYALNGAHQSDEDFAYFHLPPVQGWSVAQTTLFGVSCNRQITVKELKVTTPEFTRTIVQKAVVVLARQPIFGPIRAKLAVVTAAWFAQGDFTNTDILNGFYSSLNTVLAGEIDDASLYIGTSLRELVHKFKSKTLTLLKLLLLEKRILFYGYPVERLCTLQYSLISLIPGLLRHLQDSGAPELDTSRDNFRLTEARELKSGDKQSLLSYMGLPLYVFQKGAFFQPYLPLQQIDILSAPTTSAYLVGTTNQIFLHHKAEIGVDVLVNVEQGTLEFYNQGLSSLVGLTMADRRWMDKIFKTVNDTWDVNDPTRPTTNSYSGSDDFLRARFEEYVLSLLSSVKHAQSQQQGAQSREESAMQIMQQQQQQAAAAAALGVEDGAYEIPAGPGERDTLGSGMVAEKEKNYLTDYNTNWITAWYATNNYKVWDDYTDHEIYEIVEPGHPGQGNFSIEDIQNQLSNRFKDLNLDQNLAPLKHSLGKAVTTGGEKLSRAVTNGSKGIGKAMEVLWAELEKGLDSGASSAAGPDREKEKKRRSLGPVYKSETDLNRSPLSSYPPRQMTPLRTSTSNSASTSGDGTILGAINLEATTQQAGKLLSNVGTFFRNRQREIATAVREGWEPDRSAPATASAPPPSSSSGNNYGRRAVSLRLPTVMRPASGATPESQAGSRSVNTRKTNLLGEEGKRVESGAGGGREA